MTYQARNKPQSDSFSKIIRFCNNLLSNYQNLCLKCTQWFRRDAGGYLGEEAGKVYGPQVLIVPLKQCYCCKNNTLRRLRPQGSLKPQQFTEMTPLT